MTAPEPAAVTVEQLKPCPFCGGEPEIEDRWDAISVDCKRCYAGAGPHDTEAEAIAAWNTRNEAMRQRKALEEARLQLEYLDERFPTGTTPAVLARIDAALSGDRA